MHMQFYAGLAGLRTEFLRLTYLVLLGILYLEEQGILQKVNFGSISRERSQNMKFDKGLMAGSSTLLVLSLLEGGDMYGYQMIVELSRRSDHTFEMKEGTLYPVLHGLERDGAVEAYQQEAPTGRMRKYYRLTRRGAAVLREEAAAWQTYSGAVNAVLRACPGLDPA